MSHVIGIDTSTTATKAIVIDKHGSVVGAGASMYDYETPHPQWAEQDPNLWWDAAVIAIRTALGDAGVAGSSIDAVGLTGQMHGLALLDDGGKPVRPALLWNDQRTQAECDEMRSRVGAGRLIEITGNDALTGFTAPKLLWVRNHEPEVFEQARHALLPKDFVRLQLSGEYATDRAGASGTQLFDLATRDWSDEVLDSLAIDKKLLPPTFEGTAVTGSVSDAAGEQTGLAAGTPIVGGGGDQAANAVGTGVVDPGALALSLGTSGVVFAATDAPDFDPNGRVHAFCHAVADRWHMMGVMLSAAGSLRWFRDTLAPGTSFEELIAEAAEIPPGAQGLLFLPYLTGERTPHADPAARGAFIGLTVRHGRGHLVRAVLEGVAFGLREGLDLMVAAGLRLSSEIRASGGGTKSSLWNQIMADVLGAEIATVNTSEGAAYGAGLLAAVGAGWYQKATDAATDWVTTTERVTPSDHDYRPIRSLYQKQYEILRDTFADLGGATN